MGFEAEVPTKRPVHRLLIFVVGWKKAQLTCASQTMISHCFTKCLSRFRASHFLHTPRWRLILAFFSLDMAKLDDQLCKDWWKGILNSFDCTLSALTNWGQGGLSFIFLFIQKMTGLYTADSMVYIPKNFISMLHSRIPNESLARATNNRVSSMCRITFIPGWRLITLLKETRYDRSGKMLVKNSLDNPTDSNRLF